LSKAEAWHLLDVWRQQVDYPTLLRTARDLKKTWTADHVVIEKAGVGYARLAELRKEFGGELYGKTWAIFGSSP
jgi:hypothetical protein